MTRPSPLWLIFALGGLACTPKPETFGPPDSGETVSTTSGTSTSSSSSSGGAGGSTASGGGTASGGSTASGGGTGTAGGGTGGAGGMMGPCEEDPATIPAEGHYFTPPPSKCHCKEEAAEMLPLLAQAAKDHHDTNNDVGCTSAGTVPTMVPSQTYYVPYSTGLGLDFDTGSATGGWLCLGVTMPEVIHCRYSFTKGSTPISQSLGGPGVNKPEGFEVVAQGDADGDGVLATFAIIGNINANNELVLVPFENNVAE